MDIRPFLDTSAARHDHLCPRQVLGVRIGLLAVKTFGLPPGGSPGRRLLAIVESDGCFADGVEAATGCSLGHRTLRLEDYGKIAASFVDAQTGRAVRIAPVPDARQRARDCLPQEPRRYQAQLAAYQLLPDEDLLTLSEIFLNISPEQLLSRHGLRRACSLCGEEIHNGRELVRGGQVLCRACAGDGYYQHLWMPALLEQA